MKNNTLSITAFVVVILAIVATLAMIAFAEGIRKIEWMDLESTVWACFGFAILGCVLGWCAFNRPLGKISAILGTIVVAGFIFQLFRDGDPVSSEPPTVRPNVEANQSDNSDEVSGLSVASASTTS